MSETLRDIPTHLTCGTRTVVKRGITYRVVCATCGRGGSVPHPTASEALRAACRDSTRPCPCGAR